MTRGRAHSERGAPTGRRLKAAHRPQQDAVFPGPAPVSTPGRESTGVGEAEGVARVAPIATKIREPDRQESEILALRVSEAKKSDLGA